MSDQPKQVMELTGRTAVVTGGNRGFGRGVVEALAREGMRVVAVSRDAASLANMVGEVGGSVGYVAADVRDSTAAVDVIQAELPDVLVLAAGSIAPIQEVQYLTWEAFNANWDVDVRGTFLWAREALLAPLPPGSAILIVSSTAAGSSSPRIAGYSAAKTAQVTLAKSFAEAGAPLGIRVHYLLPTLTSETDLGARSTRIFARRAGISEQAVLEEIGHVPPLRPISVGMAVVDILTNPNLVDTTGFRISEDELKPLGDDHPLLLP